MAVVVMEQEARAGSLAPAVKARMEAFVAQVAGAAMNHPVQRANAEVYVRGLLAAGARKSLEPLVERLDGGWGLSESAAVPGGQSVGFGAVDAGGGGARRAGRWR